MQIKTKIALLAALILTFFCAGNAKADYWTRYNSTNSDLPANSYVYKVVKDSRGAKWVYGSANGSGFLYVFDGTWHDYSETMYGYEGSGWSIQHMYANDAGDVWFTFSLGTMLRYDGSSWTRFTDNDAQDIVGQLYYPGHTVENAYILFYSVFGDPSSATIYTFASFQANIDGAPATGSYKILKRNSSGQWSIAAEDGEFLTYTSAYSHFGHVSPSNGDLWFSLRNSSGAGVYRYNGSWKRYTTSDGLISSNVSDLYADSSGNVWAATDRGVSKFNGSSWESWTTDNSNLATNVVTSVDGGSDGKIWFVSTYNSDTSTQGGTSTYNPADGFWSYYSIRNGDSDFGTAQYIFIMNDEMWATVGSSGVLALTKNNDYTTIYGQVNGQTVEKAVYSELKKKNKTKWRKVDIWKLTQVQKKNKKWKTVRRKVYHTKTSDWYKVINMETGNYMVKVQGKTARTVGIASGDPYRLNF